MSALRLPGMPERDAPEWLLRHIGRRHRRSVDALLSRYALHKPGQPVILMILQAAQDQGRSVSQGEIAEALRVSNPTVTASLKSLERQGYIRREPDERDMRRKHLVITELGREVAERCRTAFRTVDAAMLEGFTDQEREETARLARKILDNLDRLDESVKL